MVACEKLFSRLRSGLKKHRKGAIFSIALLSFFIVGGFVLADDPTSIDGLTNASWYIQLMAVLGIIIQAIAWGVGQLVLIVIGILVIPILGYNNFGGSYAVELGWSLIRDVVNMFVVVIILVIAIQTILGLQKANWQQQLPRLFIAVIAVNFSKTITLFLIDIGQVLMFTFVNALRDIAAGNFVNLFGINSFFEISEQAAEASQGGMQAFAYLATTYLTLTLLLSVLAVLMLMTIIFLYRIVILWVLIIMSPIAFFAAGNKGLLDTLGNSYSQWWQKLVGAITIGPILAFFLWLSLAMASGGPIAETEGFTELAEADTGGIARPLTEVFEDTNLLSLFLALVMLMVGFQVASAAAAQVGGVAAKFVNEKGGRALVGGAAALPGKLAYRTGRAGVRAGVAVGTRGASEFAGRSKIPSQLAAGLTRSGESLRKRGGIAGIVGGGIIATGAAGERKLSGLRTSQRGDARKNVEGYTSTQKFTELASITEANTPMRLGKRDERDFLLTDLATNKNTRKGFKDHLETTLGKEQGAAKFESMMASSMNHVRKNKDDLIGDDEAKKKAFFKTQAENLHMLEPDQIQEIVDDDDFKVGQLSGAAAQDSNVQSALEKKVVRTYKDENGVEQKVNAYQDLMAGKGVNQKVKDAMRTGASKEQLGTAHSGAIANGLASGTINIAELNVEALQGANADNIVQGIVEAREKGADISSLQGDALMQFEQRAEAMKDVATPVDQRKIDRALFGAAGEVADIGVQQDGSISAGKRLTVEEEIKLRPQDLHKFSDQVAAGGAQGNDISSAIASATDKVKIDSLAKQYGDASSDEIKEQLRQSVSTIKDSIAKEIARVQNEGGNTKQLTELQRRADSTQRLMS
jgi:hypothetical protein